MEEEIVKGEEIIATPEEVKSAETPVEEVKVEEPVVEAPAEEPAEVPAEEPQEVPAAEEAADSSAAEPAEEVADSPAAEPVEEVVEEPSETPKVEEAVEKEAREEKKEAREMEKEKTAEEKEEETTEARPTTCAEVVAKLKELESHAADVPREVLEQLKQTFYRIHSASVAEAREAFVAAGNDADAFIVADQCPEEAALEEEFKQQLNTIREVRAEAQKELDRVREENLRRKEELLARLKTMIDNADIEQVSYDDFQAIQQEWRSIKDVPPEKSTELWKTYQSYTEKFYDIRKLNNMFRDYDFKKNLEIKTRLCEEAEQLANDPDVVGAFRRLQKLHQEYRETGPVAKDLREETWNRFKAASTVVNRRHQEHFEAIKKEESENLESKIAICEIMESIDYEALTSYTLWNEKTKEVLALQDKWKTLGFASRKQNQKVFERFRAACDTFFTKKGEFYKTAKDSLATNLERKLALCEQAEALKDSTDWKATADKMVALQKEWKTIGPVPKKQSEVIWKRFVTACDTFFANRADATSSQRSEERKNLATKKSIIKSLQELSDSLEAEGQEAIDELGDKLRSLVADWNATGHVPFKEKDKIFKQYRALVDDLFDKLHVSESSRRVSNFRKNIREMGSNVDREREKLMLTYERVKNEIKTYENNLGFLTSSSKSGSNLMAEMQRKMEKLKSDAQELLNKIKALDEPEEGEK
ncbi:MAG: DUF349 domain-containing protein [Bacteroidaceae bacterium]|nr:DUF349 domain-containing protein [Bacteroidaceae bacterium]MBP5322851.1 DUF349 domain-containing protein [Bacteroidaceae bacterium]